MNKELKIMLGIAAVVILGGAALFVFANPQPKEASKPVDEKSLIREGNHTVGSKDAKVKLVEFGDYQCPACAAADPIIKQIVETYKDNPNFSFTFRHFPLTSIHKNAQSSAEAAEAAGEQGKYWEMHHALYEKQTEWDVQPDPTALYKTYAMNAGVADIGKFESSMKNRTFSEIVSTDYRDGETLGVNSTPTFFLNGEKLEGVPKFEQLKSLIDEKLK